MNQTNEPTERTAIEKGIDDLQNNTCITCREGLLMGDSVYCSVDGRFISLANIPSCINYIAKKAVVKGNIKTSPI